jgi:hypothetical protein
LVAGLVAIPPEALAVLAAVVVVTVQVLVALELLGKAMPVVIVATLMGVLVVVAQVKPDLTGRNLSQLAVGTALRHQSQEHQLHALAVVVAEIFSGLAPLAVLAAAVQVGVLVRAAWLVRQILVAVVAVAAAREQERRAVQEWSLSPCQQPTTAA